MSRIRSIHPGLWTDEAFVALNPFARLLFMGIWNECDDMGSFAWSPLGLKMKILPADNADANVLLDEMIAAGIVMRYESGGKAYGAVRNFCQFQRPKKPNSTFPQTDEVREWVNLNARDVRTGGEPVGNRSGSGGENRRQMEDGGDNKKEEETPPIPPSGGKRGKSSLPQDWQLPPVADLPPKARACAEQWTQASYETEGEGFVLYWRSTGKMMKDWDATWANRVIARHEAVVRAQKFGNAAPPDRSGKGQPKTPEYHDEQAQWFDDHGMPDEAAEHRRKAEHLRKAVTA